MTVKKTMRAISLALVLCLLASSAPAQETSLRQFAESCLTEVFGYTADEAADFVFEAREDGSLAYWPKKHPAWVYTACRNEYGQLDAASPFHTVYIRFCGEGAVHELLKSIREQDWMSSWSEGSKAAFLDECLKSGINISTETYLAETPALALQGFFESCYGPAAGWTDALFDLRNCVFAEYGLTPEEAPFHVSGVRSFSLQRDHQSDAVRTYTLFEGGTYPEELKEAFSDPHLTGWTCSGGAVRTDESKCDPGKENGLGLAAFEKDGKRQLVQLNGLDGQWTAYPLGTNALYPTGDYRVTYVTRHNAFAVQYRLSDDETAAFYLSPGQTRQGECDQFYTSIGSYERINRKTGEAVWISLSGSGMPTWQKELTPDDLRYPVIDFPCYLGAAPITEFPTTPEAARQYACTGMPEGYVYTVGVNLRTRRSSRSASYGMLNAGTLLPVLERLPGDPSEWIRTKAGFLEGFVAGTYVCDGQTRSAGLSALPVAETLKETPLKKGTGLFDGTLQTLPAGTKMHVIIDNGDWLYVDAPRGEIGFLMDVNGIFGYVRRTDVTFLNTIPGLCWAE